MVNSHADEQSTEQPRCRPLNVLIVTDFSLDDLGGVTVMVQTLEDQLASRCRFVYLEADWNARRLVHKSNSRGRPLYYLRLRLPYDRRRPFWGFAGWVVGFPGSLNELKQLVHAESIDVVHLHFGAADQYWFRLLKFFRGIPYLLTLHGSDVRNFPAIRRADRALMRYAMKGAAAVVACSKSLSEDAQKNIGIPGLKVIPNGVDIELIDSIEAGANRTVEGRTLPERFCVMISNVIRRKGQDVAIRAWSAVNARDPSMVLIVVGALHEAGFVGECNGLVAEAGLQNVVQFWGQQPHEVGVKLLRFATAVIIPSRYEGLPYVLLEAAAAGCPVICSDIPSFVDVVEHEETALVTPLDDHEAVANAVLRLSADKELSGKLSANLSMKVRSEHSASTMARRYYEEYASAIAASSPRARAMI